MVKSPRFDLINEHLNEYENRNNNNNKIMIRLVNVHNNTVSSRTYRHVHAAVHAYLQY